MCRHVAKKNFYISSHVCVAFFTSLEEMVSYFYDEISRMVNDSTRFMNLTEALYAYSHV